MVHHQSSRRARRARRSVEKSQLWTIQFHHTVFPYVVVDDRQVVDQARGKTNQFSDNKQIPMEILCCPSGLVFHRLRLDKKRNPTDNGKETDRSFETSSERATGRRGGAKRKSYLREDGTGDAEGDGRLGDLLGELLHVSASGRLDGGSVAGKRRTRLKRQ